MGRGDFAAAIELIRPLARATQTGAVALIQRFGSALNLNIHFHLLVLDGVYLRAMTWAQRLKRVFGIAIETCEQCGGPVKVIASNEDATVIGRILGHLASRELPAGSRPPSRGPPQGELKFP
jgi:rRNA maturation endonuclease Nob1